MRVLVFSLLLASSLQAVELRFPTLADATRLHGELVSVDFVHRSGQFRAPTGELVDFTMPPYAIMKYRGAESDLRDVPLGSTMDFVMLPGGRLLTTDDHQSPDPAQQTKFREFTERRGVAGWIDKTEAKTVTVTLFSGDPAFFESAYGDLLAKGKATKTCVANDELRTWNPGVDGEGGSILEVKKLPPNGFGNSGYQITVSVSNMLEGFRCGRVVRIFLAGWKVQDQFYGESLMGYGYSRMLNQELVENVAKEYAEQFPFRTDYGNAHLPWYQLRSGVKPPPFSEHLVIGELIKADTTTRTGGFRTDRTGEIVTFNLHEPATLKHLANDAKLDALLIGQRYRFHLYQDDNGRFTRVAAISDDVSHQTANHVTYRIIAIRSGALTVAWQLPETKNYNGDMERPAAIGHSVLLTTPSTRVWNDGVAGKLTDLKPNDTFRFNQTAEFPTTPAHVTDLWLTVDKGEDKK